MIFFTVYYPSEDRDGSCLLGDGLWSADVSGVSLDTGVLAPASSWPWVWRSAVWSGVCLNLLSGSVYGLSRWAMTSFITVSFLQCDNVNVKFGPSSVMTNGSDHFLSSFFLEWPFGILEQCSSTMYPTLNLGTLAVLPWHLLYCCCETLLFASAIL